MFIIGITGGTGSGKTSALRVLRSLGALTLDCDAVYHELLSGSKELIAELDARFPGVAQDGVIDRKMLGGIVFADPSALLDLNAITHKYISAEIDGRIADWEAQGGRVTAVDAIALIESRRSEKCDVVVGVIAPVETRIGRVMRRDGISREQAEMRVSAQKPDSFYREHCDHILESNNSNIKKFNAKCRELFTKLLTAVDT